MFKLFNYVMLFLMFSVAAVASEKEEEFTERLDYQVINPPVPTITKGNKIEVVEMFFFACPHCYKLEPTIDKWLKEQKDDVEFIRVPAIIGPTWAVQAKAFYIAEKLGIADKVRKNLFKAIHHDGRQIYNEYALMKFFAEQGVNENHLLELFNSPEIVQLASEARIKTVKYGIRGVPAIIVNGKYYTATYYTRDHEKLMKIVDHLVDKERKSLLKVSQKTQ